MSMDKEPCGYCGELAVNDDYSERCNDCGWLFHYPNCFEAHDCRDQRADEGGQNIVDSELPRS